MMEFKVDAMSCGHCVTAVTKAVQAVDPMAKISIDLDSHRVQVETSRSRSELAASLEDAGYPVSEI